MRILLLTGIKEELEPVLRRLPFSFDKEIGAYRCVRAANLACATTGPGLRKKTEVRRMLERFEPDVILNAGLVGILRENDGTAPGDPLRLGNVIHAGTEEQYPGGPGQDILVTVKAPVFDPSDKLGLAARFHARACDMEAAELLALLGRYPLLSGKGFVVFSKIVGDRPEDHALFAGEALARDWESKSWPAKMRTAMRFPGGPTALMKLRRLRRNALRGLEVHTLAVVRELLSLPETEDPVDLLTQTALDSVFLAH